MVLQSVWQHTFGFLPDKPILVEPVEAQLSSDGGLLPIRQFDETIGLTAQFAAALDDPRQPELTRHAFAEMARMRIYGIVADYEDQNDHDVLRSDPIFKIIAGRAPDARDLASQPTLSRFENAISVPSLVGLQDVLIDQFIAALGPSPGRLTFDIDVFDDPTHGAQQLTFYHGFYEQYQYLPRVITCANNDMVVMVTLLFGTAHAALGADDDLELLVGRLRQRWPDLDIELRGDAGLAVPRVYETCERLEIIYTFGLRMNPVLQRNSEETLAEAVRRYEATGQAQRLFSGFWYQADSWPAPRWVVVKCEANAQGTNRRAVVTNRPGALVLPAAAYDEYAERGESENRNKELKCGLNADRLSDHRYMANLFRLYLHTAALNLMVRLRRAVANPPAAPDLRAAIADDLSRTPDALPVEALAGRDRKRYQNRRREHDPLGEGQPCTWRTRLVKVACAVFVRARLIRVQLSSCWPYLEHFRRISAAITPPAPAPLPSG
jgi:hypothetical protein